MPRPSQPAAEGKHQAFGEHLANQAGTAGSQRGADGDLLAARSRARQQEIREIGTGDQKDGADRAQQREQPAPETAGQVFLKAAEFRAEFPPVGVALPDLDAEHIELVLRLLNGDAGLEATEHRQRVAPAVGFLSEGKGHDHVDAGAGSEDRS